MMVPRQPCTSVPNRRRVILLVEDEPFLRDATRRTLESAGFEVLPVGDAPEAMKAYARRQGKIDLLMTDMTLPGRSGRQLSVDLRATSAQLPILLTSGYLENDWAGQQGEPRTYFISKPYTRSELVEAVENILGSAVQRKAIGQAG